MRDPSPSSHPSLTLPTPAEALWWRTARTKGHFSFVREKRNARSFSPQRPFIYLGDGVVDVDGGHLQLAALHHLVKIVHSRRGLL